MMDVEHKGSDPLPIESNFAHLKFKLDCDAHQREHLGQDVLLKVQKGKISEIDFNLNHGGLFRNSHSARKSNVPLVHMLQRKDQCGQN